MNDILEISREQVKELRFLRERLVNGFVIAEPSTGHVFFKDGSLSPILSHKQADGNRVAGNVACFRREMRTDAALERARSKAEEAFAKIKELNPTNTVVAECKIMSLHAAMDKQIEMAESLIEMIENAAA